MLKKLIVVCLILSTQVYADDKNKNYSVLNEVAEVINVFKQCSRMTPSFRTSYNPLDEEKVKMIENMLPAALKKFAPNKKVDLDDYYRQYVSFGMLRREIIYVNAIHKVAAKKWAGKDPARIELLDNWQTKSISICGEPLHWGAIYDGSHSTISEIQFNRPIKPEKNL